MANLGKFGHLREKLHVTFFGTFSANGGNWDQMKRIPLVDQGDQGNQGNQGNQGTRELGNQGTRGTRELGN